MATQAQQDQERLLPLRDTGPDEEPYPKQPTYPRERPWKKNLPWLLTTLLALSTTILAIQLSRGDAYQHTGDINGLAPRFTQRIHLFHASHEATASIGHPDQRAATEAYWETFAPNGFGLLNLPDYSPKRYPELAPPTVEPGGWNLVDTSMAHQLHCLHSIMEAYNDLAEKVNRSSVSSSASSSASFSGMQNHQRRQHWAREDMPKHHDHSWHLGHCFDYIRQGIMCCGDTALEGAATTFPEGIKGSDGWNAKHVCKDYEEVKAWIIKMGVYE